MLRVMESYLNTPDFSEICRKARYQKIVQPKRLKEMFESEKYQMHLFGIQRSQTGDDMMRDAGYYFN